MGDKNEQIIAAGVNVAGDVANAAAVAAQNKKSREFAREMYGRQRADALADWNMQNDYNSPASQMARLKAAGLNPNLVYGSGADAQSQGTVRSSGVPGAQFDAPRFAPGDAMAAYYNAGIQQATTDNLRAQNTVLQQEALLKAAQITSTAAQTGKMYADTRMTEFDLSLKEQLREISAQSAAVGLEQAQANLKFTLDSNERAQAQNAQSIAEGIERILRSRAERAMLPAQRQKLLAEIGNLHKDGELKQLDINLKKQGIQPGDNLIVRMIAQWIAKNIPDDLTPAKTIKAAATKAAKEFIPPKVRAGLKGAQKAGSEWYPAIP